MISLAYFLAALVFGGGSLFCAGLWGFAIGEREWLIADLAIGVAIVLGFLALCLAAHV